MAFIPSAIFNLEENTANYRTIAATLEANPVPAPAIAYNIYFEVEGPIAPIKTPDFNTPDGVIDQANPILNLALVNLPIDSDGCTLEGRYVLNYYIENQNNPGVYTQESCEIDLDVKKEGPESCRIQGAIGFDVDCVCYNITAKDNTNYGDTTLESRTLTIIYPTIPGQATPPPVSTTDQTITVGFDYSNVTYIVNLESVYTHMSEDGCITVRENLLASLSQRVVCDFNLCKIVKCIEDTLRKLEYQAAQVGGWPKLDIATKDTLAQLNENWMLLQMYRLCGNYTKVYEIYQRIQDIIGCDCGCTEENTDKPVPVSPACNGAGGNITNIVGVDPIIVNQSGTTAVISFNNSVLGNINNAITSIVVAAGISQDFLSVSTVNNETTITFDPSPLAAQAWTVFDNTAVASISGVVNYTGVPQAVRYSINALTQEMRVDGFVNITDPTPVPCLNPDAPINLPAATFPNLVVGKAIPAYDSNYNVVGGVVLLPIGTPENYTLAFVTNSNWSGGGQVNINGTYNLD